MEEQQALTASRLAERIQRAATDLQVLGIVPAGTDPEVRLDVPFDNQLYVTGTPVYEAGYDSLGGFVTVRAVYDGQNEPEASEAEKLSAGLKETVDRLTWLVIGARGETARQVAALPETERDAIHASVKVVYGQMLELIELLGVRG